jgi:hypothetical protein
MANEDELFNRFLTDVLKPIFDEKYAFLKIIIFIVNPRRCRISSNRP